ncbi:MAG: NYN domain-containing protein [Lutibacter sp.]
MNIYKVAILFDGAFFRKRYCIINHAEPHAAQVGDYIRDIMTRINALTQTYDTTSQDILFRVFYYDCRPYGDTERKPDGTQIDFRQHPAFNAASRFQTELKTMNQIALKLGDLSFNGWKINMDNPENSPKPDFKQKGVDMKIGLDIAWMSSKKTVDKIVLIAGDSDFVSPMKLARKEGLLVYLDAMGQTQIKIVLKEHADFII